LFLLAVGATFTEDTVAVA